MKDRKSNILIVDDNSKNIQVAANMLNLENFTLGFSLSGEDALTKLKQKEYDLILLDVMMPGMNGYETAVQIKKMAMYKDTPIIFVTAKNDNEDMIKGFECGGVDYVTKPYLSAELLARVKTHLKIKNLHDELITTNRDLKENIKIKDMLFKELHHRIKNNFQVILTFLWAQKNSIKDKKSLQALDQTTRRIYTISSLHELLNISDTVSIDINLYLQGILDSFIAENNTIEYKHNIESIKLDYDEAVALGLIFNELLTNSNKYAFESKQNPCIVVDLYEKNNTNIFRYSDNGCGFDTASLADNSGLGYDLIYGFAQKNNAEISVSSDKGMELRMIFHKKEEVNV